MFNMGEDLGIYNDFTYFPLTPSISHLVYFPSFLFFFLIIVIKCRLFMELN